MCVCERERGYHLVRFSLKGLLCVGGFGVCLGGE